MSSQLQQLFRILKCTIHSSNDILQVCVSSRCTQPNKLCCLECVDEKHFGEDHLLLSHKKFENLLEQFHVVVQQRQTLNRILTQDLKKQKQLLNEHVEAFHELIQKNLKSQNQIASYEVLNQIDVKNIANEKLKTKINELVCNHSWMLQLNANSFKRNSTNELNSKENEQKQVKELARESMRSKYMKLQKKLQQINRNTELQIKFSIEKNSSQVKKLFHLFDEIKYKLDDDGNQLQNKMKNEHRKHVELTPQISPTKQSQINEQQKNKVKSFFSFLGSD